MLYASRTLRPLPSHLFTVTVVPRHPFDSIKNSSMSFFTPERPMPRELVVECPSTIAQAKSEGKKVKKTIKKEETVTAPADAPVAK